MKSLLKPFLLCLGLLMCVSSYAHKDKTAFINIFNGSDDTVSITKYQGENPKQFMVVTPGPPVAPQSKGIGAGKYDYGSGPRELTFNIKFVDKSNKLSFSNILINYWTGETQIGDPKNGYCISSTPGDISQGLLVTIHKCDI